MSRVLPPRAPLTPPGPPGEPRRRGAEELRVAYFISSHGFGHAARASAVMAAVWRRAPAARFEVFTGVPKWFFDDSLNREVGHHPGTVDFGLVQATALEEDLAATVAELEGRIPFPESQVAELADRLAALGAELVVCDIAPLGLAAARRAELPSLLVENFTWDWIYGRYAEKVPALRPFADYLAGIFAAAGRHVQAEPFCRRTAAAVSVPPMSRRPRRGRAATRADLGVPADEPMALVTMGGIEWDYHAIVDRLAADSSRRWLVVPGGSREPRRRGRLVLLPHRSRFFHPDLVHAADAVIGKLGYSTLAEVHAAGVPFGYVPRADFPESPELEAWVRRRLVHRRIEPASFTSGRWLDEVEPLLALPREIRSEPVSDGADEAAGVVLEMLGGGD